MRKMPKILMACFFLLLTHTVWAAQEAWLTSVTIMRPSVSSPETQITLQLNQTVGYKAFTYLILIAWLSTYKTRNMLFRIQNPSVY